MTKNSEIVRKTIETIILILLRKTSPSYALILTSSFIKRASTEYKFLEGISIKTTSYTTNSKNITISSKINSIDPKELGKALQLIITEVGKTFGSEKDYFLIEIKGYLGASFIIKLENMGVKL